METNAGSDTIEQIKLKLYLQKKLASRYKENAFFVNTMDIHTTGRTSVHPLFARPVNAGALVAAIYAVMAFTLAATLTLAFPSPAQAKTLSEFDAEIAAQEQVLAEKQAASDEAQKILADATAWYYKNIASGSITDMIFEGAGVADAIDRISYMDKIYATYTEKRNAAEAAKNEAIGAKEALETLRQEKMDRARSLENAKNVQFPQGSGQAWSGIPYWNGTIASSGCGVCAYTVVIDVLTGADYTPTEMMSLRGDWRGMDGYPDDGTGVKGGGSHHDYTLDTFDVTTWNIGNSVEELKEALSEKETAAIVCSRGNAFKNNSGVWRYSSGHFVAVLGYDEAGFHVSDSAYSHEEGADVVYSDAEMAKMLRGANLVTVYSN